MKRGLLYAAAIILVVLSIYVGFFWKRSPQRKEIIRDPEPRRYKYMPEYEGK